MNRFLLPLFSLVILAVCSVAQARVIYVNGTNPAGGDGASWSTAYRYLQDALVETVTGDEVWVAAGTYFPDDGAAVIKGDREASFTLIDGVNLYGGFTGTESQKVQATPEENVTILSGEIWPDQIYWSIHVVSVLGKVTIDGFTVTKGNANGLGSFGMGGGIFFTQPSKVLTVNRCEFLGNSATNGGAVYVHSNSSRIIVTDSTFISNTALSSGGAIWGTMTATKCMFLQNSSSNNGGALYCSSSYQVITKDCDFSGNLTSESGGAIYASHTPIIASGSTFKQNFASSRGGAIYASSSPLTLENCEFSMNVSATTTSTSPGGGAIHAYYSKITASDCLFFENSASRDGGAIYASTSSPIIAKNCEFTGNTATRNGGAIFASRAFSQVASPISSITALICKFSYNTAGSGGAIRASSDYPILAISCIYFKNSASSIGGAIYGRIRATNCAFMGNSALNNGGAILGRTTATNCTFFNNYLTGVNPFGNNIYSSEEVGIYNNIMWTWPDVGQQNLIYVTSSGSLRNSDSNFPSPINLANNLLKDGMSSVIVEDGAVVSLGDTSVTILTSNPVFMDTANPAGPDGIFGTADDGLRLLPGSPAIDMGLERYLPKDVYDLDQDGDTEALIPVDLAGFTRIQGAAPDLGAYEFGEGFASISIIREPESMTLAAGMRASFSVEAVGYALRYQWYLGVRGDVSEPITDATDNFLGTEPLVATSRYWVRVSNGATHVDSQTATVMVVPVKIASQPQNRTIAIGAMADLSVTALGEELQFQWYRGAQGDRSQPIVGANSPTYRTAVLTEDALFWVEITGLHGMIASDTATISVTQDLLAAALYAGSNLFYTSGGNAEWFVQNEVTYSGGDALRSGLITHNQSTYVETAVETPGTISFWWRVSSQSGGDFLRFYINGVLQTGSISGTTGNWAQRTFTVTTAGPHVFRWAYTKNASTDTGSDCGWLDEVMWTPKLITSHPEDARILAGTSASMSVDAQGNALTYQWYEGDSGVMTDPIPGAVGPQFTTQALDSNRKYWVKAGNGIGFEHSETVTIHVHQPDSAIAATLGSGEGIGFFTWGDQPWVSQTETTFDGSPAMQSGSIGHSQASVLEAAVSGPGQLDFWWKVSSEFGFDFLSFSIDGELQTGISGEVDWQQASYQLSGTGTHRLRWEYRKDETKTTGSDRGWLDAVVWAPDGGSPVTFASWTSSYGLTGDDSMKNATPANDGVSNLMKYALGLDPHVPAFAATDGTNPGLPAMQMDVDHMHFVFIKDTAKIGISYTVETWEGSGNWETVTEGISEAPLEGSKVRVTVSLPRTERQFCRLKVAE